MPFLSPDWRGPGDEWVKCQDGWETRYPPLSSSPHTLHPPLFIPTSYSSHSPPLILFPFTSNSFLQPNPLLSKIQTSTLFLIRNMAMYFLIIITEVLKGIIINRNTSSKSKDQLKLLEQSIISV